MREDPPAELVALLDRLGLASRDEIRGVYRRARRMAREMPLFECVWVDALQQAGVLTAFQAAEVNAGRGESLGVGPFVLCQARESFGYGTCYRALNVETRRSTRLTVIPLAGADAEIASQCAKLVERNACIATPVAARSPDRAARPTESLPAFPAGVIKIENAGVDGERLWLAAAWQETVTAADWMIRHGRLSPEMVLEIARQMTATLAQLEQAGQLHTDVAATRLLFTLSGDVLLAEPELRGLVRPEEGYAHAGLIPEAYDYLAPERVSDAGPPTTASDLYACGCLWWHLLTGRPPLGGGNSLRKLRAAQSAKIPDLRRLAAGVPDVLADAVRACQQRNPRLRPASFAALSAELGPSTVPHQRALARAIRRGSPSQRRLRASRATSDPRPVRHWLATAAAGMILVAASRPWWPAITDPFTGGTASAAIPAMQPRSLEPKAVAAASVGTDAGSIRHENPPARNGVQQQTRSMEAPPLPAATHKSPAAPGHAPVAIRTTIAANGDLVLDATRPIECQRLPLRKGQTVRGPSGQRPQVIVPDTGLLVDVEGVKFEQVDFIWRGTESRHLSRVRTPAIVHLAAFKCEFRGCSFQSLAETTPPAAILWSDPASAAADEISLPTGQLLLSDCVLHRVSAGVDCRLQAAIVLEAAHSLLLGPGPLARLHRWPPADAPVVIALDRSALRSGEGILACDYESVPDQPGRITIEASDCALAPAAKPGLILLTGAESPTSLLAHLEWTGQGTVLNPGVPLVVWRDADGQLHPAREDRIRVEGLLRGQLGFAGESLPVPAASRVVRWQAPRRSPDPPGLGDALLVLPSFPDVGAER